MIHFNARGSLVVSLVILLCCSFASAGDSYRVVITPFATDIVRHAANELSSYVTRMTGSGVPVATEDDPKSTVLFLLLRDDRSIGLPREWYQQQSNDAYYIQSTVLKDRHVVHIYGKSDVAILYGVYDYLQRFGHCGLFEDGEYIPKSPPQVADIEHISAPRFSLREFHGDVCGSFGLKKFHWAFRNNNEWKTYYDWLAKRRINHSSIFMSPSCNFAGDAVELAFGVVDNQPGEHYGHGWPNTWSWPAHYRTESLKYRLGYMRGLGMKAIYGVSFGITPLIYRQQHPELKWVKNDYETPLLAPDEPLSEELTRKFMKAVVDIYGTDHLYWDTPYSESAGADDYDASLKLKIAAANKDCRIFREIDPEAMWVTDSWDFSAIRKLWTPERRKIFFEQIPRDMSYFFDATTDYGNEYQATEYYYGLPWAVGVLHSFQADDYLHGDPAGLIKNIQAAADDPKSTKLNGYFNLREIHGANILYWQLSTELEWNPHITLDQFLADYTRQRYGVASFEPMSTAVDLLIKAVYSPGTGVGPYYKRLNPKEGQFPSLAPSARRLKAAIDTALTQEQTQRDNPLFENDLVDWTKAYLYHLFDYALVKAKRAGAAGQKDEFARWSKSALQCMTDIQSLLSTRSDFHLQPTIDQAMSVPGTNPSTPRMIRQHVVNDLYATNDVYEELHHFYRPRVEVFLKLLSNEITQDEAKQQYEEIKRHWLDGPIDVPASEKFNGTPMQAIHHALDDTKDLFAAMMVLPMTSQPSTPQPK